MSDELVDGVNLPLTGGQVAALAAGEVVRVEIPAEPVLDTERMTVVILRQMRPGEVVVPLAVRGVHDTTVGRVSGQEA